MDNRKLSDIESAFDFNFAGHYFRSNKTEKKINKPFQIISLPI